MEGEHAKMWQIPYKMEGEHAHMQEISCKMEGEHAQMWQIPCITMQNDKFKVQTVANTRQIVPARKSKKKTNLLKKNPKTISHPKYMGETGMGAKSEAAKFAGERSVGEKTVCEKCMGESL